MSRRRSTPWIQRWSRPIIGAIAIVGAILTAYLTVVKLTGGEVTCAADAAASASSCNDVLNSPYATVFGLPLSLFGFLAYTSMSVFALGPIAMKGEGNKRLKNQLENWTWLLLLAGATSMSVFSSYLMYILTTEIQAVCLYCIGSALFSLSLLILTVIGREWEDFGQIFFTGTLVAMVTLVGTLGVYSGINSPEVTSSSGQTVIPVATTQPVPPYGWEITTTSGEAEIALANYLTEIGVKNYGAFWCPHCYEQKQLFGKKAFAEIDYIECDPRGVNPQQEVCQATGIKSYPTWEIKGQLYPGVKTLDELAELSDYQGTKNFKYTMPES
ncbi:vitamin K epoxide reductase family protein [Oscillatoria salina]|uniref:vitamin K epoxide reductase family protein n=1 Tax=Oscillatoria salina TaxID=331517 RepID=UPI0013BC5C33|nr:vitamin K epoxide reductase family protein [Oscillatoria salina]MBZ8181219.1 vitamin K epoxide reductase family protein [Oscillatoria salina IIICB1]NET86782.1 vitamin K epoxide reductase family protein [Kamptonema sp. SIO1D9]